MAIPYVASPTLRGAERRHPSSSVAPVASGDERSLRPRLACFSRPEGTTCSGGDR
jgi:hypothetical protein